MTVRPSDPIKIEGATQSQLMGLTSLGVDTYADLARLDPYDSKFKGYGEDFARWVNSARALVADSVVRKVEVGEAILVEAAKVYERGLILKAVSSRLGIFLRYVQEDIRVSDDSIEVVYRRRLDDPLSLGPWLEYKMNARFYAAYLRSSRLSSQEIRQPVERPVPFDELLSWFLPYGLRGPLSLVTEVVLVSLLSDGLHVAVLEKGVIASTVIQRALEKVASYIHFHCGSHLKAVELAEMFSAGGVVFLEGLERCSGEEALVFGETVRRQRVNLTINGQTVDYELPVRIIAFLGFDSGQQGDSSSLSRLVAKFPARVYVPEIVGERAYELSRFSSRGGEDERLARYLVSARRQPVRVIPVPQAVEEGVAKLFRESDGLWPLGLNQGDFLMEAAKARCRARLSDILSTSDFEYALDLLVRIVGTWGGLKGTRKGGRRKRVTVSA